MGCKGGCPIFFGMVHRDMGKLPAAAQEERRRQVVGLRESGLTYAAIAAQTGLTANGVSGICRRYAERGFVGLASGRRGPARPLARGGCCRRGRKRRCKRCSAGTCRTPWACPMPCGAVRRCRLWWSSIAACAWRCAAWGHTWHAGVSLASWARRRACPQVWQALAAPSTVFRGRRRAAVAASDSAIPSGHPPRRGGPLTRAAIREALAAVYARVLTATDNVSAGGREEGEFDGQ